MVYTDAKIKGSIANSQIAVCDGTTDTIYGVDSFKYEVLLEQMTMLGGVRFGILPLISVVMYTPDEGDFTIISKSNGSGMTTIQLPAVSSAWVGKIYFIKNLTNTPGEQVEVRPDGLPNYIRIVKSLWQSSCQSIKT
jgi:hypothetical protein